MSVFTVSATGLGFVRGGSGSNWELGAAYQGRYGAQGARVGVMTFSGLRQVRWSEQIIEQVRIRLTFGAAGSDAPKTISLYRGTRDVISGAGSTMIGGAIGSVGSNGDAYSNTTIITLNASTNATVFENFTAFLRDGETGSLVVYRDEQPTSYDWSRNYLRITAAAIEITYEPAGSGGTLSHSSVNAGEQILLAVAPQADADTTKLTHSVEWRFGARSAIQSLGINAYSASFVIPVEWLTQIPDAPSGEAQCVLSTLEGGVVKATRTLTFTITAPDSSAPLFTPVIAPTAHGGYYQYISGALISARNAAAQYGASIAAWSITSGEGLSSDAPSAAAPAFQTPGTKTFIIRATDSRGKTRSAAVSCTVVAVAKPAVQRFSVERYSVIEGDETTYEATDYGENVWVSVSAACDPIGGINSARAYILFGPSGSAMRTRVDLDVTDGVIALDRDRTVLPAPVPAAEAYEFTLCITDLTGTVMGFASVGIGRCNVHFAGSGYGVGIGRFSTGTKSAPRFNVAYPTLLDEALTVSGGLDAPGVTTFSEGRVPTGGRWIDGKPVYREMIPLGAVGATAAVASIGNVDALITLRGQAVDGQNRRIPLPFGGASLHATADAAPDVMLVLDSAMKIASGYVEALYTRFGLIPSGTAPVALSMESNAFEFAVTDDGAGSVTVLSLGGAELAADRNGKVQLI